MSADEEAVEATLELAILLYDGARRRGSSAFFLLSKSKPFAMAWIDPAAKRSTKALFPGDPNPKIHLPLSYRLLSDPGATLTIQILSPRFPFRRGASGATLEGVAAVPLSSLPAAAADTITLSLRRPSGRVKGFVRLSARVFWCLGAPPRPQAVPSMDRSDRILEADTAARSDSGKIEFFRVEANAPPMPGKLLPPQAPSAEFFRVEPNALPLPEENAWKPPAETYHAVHPFDWVPVVATGVPMETRQVEFSKMEPTVPPRREEKGRERGPWRSILVGLMSGTLAAVLVAAVGLSEG